tara:strand:- start:1895 stop:2701 length:807 start_codon:yes stop_codon:yes gene_type:complete
MLLLGAAVPLLGFVSVGRAPARAPRHQLGIEMATPRVPYKPPGMDFTQWVDIYNRMYRERIIFISSYIDDDLANMMIAVMLFLESEDAKSPVSMYMSVPGGNTKAGLAMYDTMSQAPYDIQTVNMGLSAQVGAFLVAGGTPGKRIALPNSRFAMMNPRLDPPLDNEGKPRQRIYQATEMRLEVAEVLRDKKRTLEGFSKFTGRPIELLEKDFKRDFYLDASEAKQYGLVDKILQPKAKVAMEAIKAGAGLGAPSDFSGGSAVPTAVKA